jgi:oligopeptide/dipeptide ABC transporter ATP-binding protein
VSEPSLLSVEGVAVDLPTPRGNLRAVDQVDLSIGAGRTLGIVGESGCGKTMLSRAILQLLPKKAKLSGRIMFDGQDLAQLNRERLRQLRGRSLAVVFQDPMTSLNPVLTISRQLTEMLELHLKMDRQTARKKAAELLKMVGIPDGERRLDDYPHQFSGGMRQRVMIAMALSCNPSIVIADEPTTALDVTTQAQLLEMMTDMVNRSKTSLIIVTHNLGVVARYVQRIYVMYSGRVVESGLSEDIFLHPLHPYTVGLLRCVPKLGETRLKRKLVPIEGLPPSLVEMPPTCAFLPRCYAKNQRCETDPWPALKLAGNQHYVACYAEMEGNKGR